jgi:hypothetical protein
VAVEQDIRITAVVLAVTATGVDQVLEYTIVDLKYHNVKDKQHQEVVEQVHHEVEDVAELVEAVWLLYGNTNRSYQWHLVMKD